MSMVGDLGIGAVTALTLDVDWAPDFVIDAVATRLIERGVRATWFVTHSSGAIDRLHARPDLFELGIHPNFLPGSSHGATPETVIEACLALVPGARTVRTHALVQSTLLLDMMVRRGIQLDVSLYLPRTPDLRPIDMWLPSGKLMRIPYGWEDDFEMYQPSPVWHIATPQIENEPPSHREASHSRQERQERTINIFDFHPIHVYLNSADMKPYQALKANVPRMAEATADEVAPFVHQGEGTDTMFGELIDYLSANGGGMRISDIAAQHTAENTP